ncbi:MAG: L-threonylcarbamoyladenylate synthase [Phormidesmis sp.]
MPQVSLDQMARALATAPTLVSFPTDTVPALAACPEHAELIYAAKHRPPEKPLILMGASLSALLPYVAGDAATQDIWQRLAAQHWPGQLTLVLPMSDRTSPTLNPLETGTLGIRVPDHPTALALLTRTGPLATTSANFSGQPPLTALADIARAFPTALTLPADVFQPASFGRSSGTPSTVALWTEQGWKILRQGEIRL